MRFSLNALYAGICLVFLSTASFANETSAAHSDVRDFLKIKQEFHKTNHKKLAELFKEGAFIEFKNTFSNGTLYTNHLLAKYSNTDLKSSSKLANQIRQYAKPLKLHNIHISEQDENIVIVGDVYFAHNCFNFPAYNLILQRFNGKLKIARETFGYSEANYCDDRKRAGSLTKRNALRIFNTTRKLWRRYDPKVSIYYAEGVKYIERRKRGYGTYTVSTEKSSFIPYKDPLKIVMKGYKAKNKREAYYNPVAEDYGDKIVIKAIRRNVTKCFSDHDFYVIIKKTDHGLQIVEEQITKAGKSHCQEAGFGFGISSGSPQNASFNKAGLEKVLSE